VTAEEATMYVLRLDDMLDTAHLQTEEDERLATPEERGP
jgi:hypothetical protein